MATEEGQDNITIDMINEAAKKVIGQTVGIRREKLFVSIPQTLRIRKSIGAGSPSEVQRMIKDRQACLTQDNLWCKQEIERTLNSKLKLDSVIKQLSTELRGKL